MTQIIAFERRQIAQIVGVSYALIKNWSNGKTFEIFPSVRAPRERGAIKLYSLTELYLMTITATLKRHGVHPDFVRRLLPLLNPAWFRKEKRGVVIYGRSSRGRIRAVHVMNGLRRDPLAVTLNWPKLELGGWLNLRQTLDRVDRKVAMAPEKTIQVLARMNHSMERRGRFNKTTPASPVRRIAQGTPKNNRILEWTGG